MARGDSGVNRRKELQIAPRGFQPMSMADLRKAIDPRGVDPEYARYAAKTVVNSVRSAGSSEHNTDLKMRNAQAGGIRAQAGEITAVEVAANRKAQNGPGVKQLSRATLRSALRRAGSSRRSVGNVAGRRSLQVTR